MTSASHHDTLGLRDDAPPREIRLAYLRAALEAHPDHGGSHAKMVAVNEAWEALCATISVDDESCRGSTTTDQGEDFETDADYCFDSEGESCTCEEDLGVDMYYDYGDLDETDGNYKIQLADGTEITLEEHEKSCGCDCDCWEDRRHGGYTDQSDDEVSEPELSESEDSDEDVL